MRRNSPQLSSKCRKVNFAAVNLQTFAIDACRIGNVQVRNVGADRRNVIAK